MSAECEIHGTDLVGNEWSEGGLVCPVCEVAAERDRIKEKADELATAVEQYVGPLITAARAYRSASPTPDAEEGNG